ncbi:MULTISPECIES: type II toxin-antitoxin system HipA family toxin [unclassified Alishewanella]|uniref:type II toxin-antitoxin system HipA family toxin n=1 Tax=unclassified Alishewanella TaxID=2628974 RepID=UPI0040422276
MAKKSKSLAILMNGERVGVWKPESDTFQYFSEWYDSPYSRNLSLSLPMAPGNPPHKGSPVKNYFDNLLPDAEAIRRRLATKYKAESASAADLLSAVGRDCVGAIQIIPENEIATLNYGFEGVELSESDIAEVLRNTVSATPINLGSGINDDGLRLSIAGAQEKNALLFNDGHWYLPVGTTPTTHILKLPLGLVGNMKADMSTSVENEWICARIAHHYGLPVANCTPMIFTDKKGSEKALVVERFDRVFSEEAGLIIRIPQEDMCQALGVNSLFKYEADGGPSALDVMKILKHSSNKEDGLIFFKTLVVFWVLAATDGHAKNFSIQLLPGNKYAMTPLYDILSAHPVIGRKANCIPKQKAKLAMAVVSKNRHANIFNIIARQWINFGEYLGMPTHNVLAVLTEVLELTPQVIETVSKELPDGFPVNVSEPIFNGMRTLSAKLSLL